MLLLNKNDSKILFVIMDGLGGLHKDKGGKTELETANTPTLDKMADEGALALLDPIGPGITPGSGPAHLALFGYDPIKDNVGRGILSALGVDFPVTGKDVCARLNFCTIDENGNVTDRRAGRIVKKTSAKPKTKSSSKPRAGAKASKAASKEKPAAVPSKKVAVKKAAAKKTTAKKTTPKKVAAKKTSAKKAVSKKTKKK